MPKELKLKDLKVAIFESRHSKTMGDLVALQGGVPVLAPSMQEIPLENNTACFDFAEKFFSGKIDILILLTGVGTRALAAVLETRYPKDKILEALKKTVIVPRGPKPIRVLREWGIPYAVEVPEPNTWRELMEAIKGMSLQGKTVAVQEYGIANDELTQALKARGAHVMPVPVYRWALPDDLEPLKKALSQIVDGHVDIALFTTSVQIDHVLQVAQMMKLENKLRVAMKHLVIGSIGPDCTETLKSRGFAPDIEPESSKMGSFVQDVSQRAEGALASKKKTKDNGAVEVRSTVLDVRGSQDLIHDSVFMKACRREATPYTPVWLMRQAGRYMKDYRDVRSKKTFLELCKDPELASQVTVHAQEYLGVDAAIIFSDILLILEPMGLQLDYVKGDGPSIANPVRTAADVDRLKSAGSAGALSYVMDAIRLTKKNLKPNIPLIGFAAAPFTLASYMIQGGSTKDFTLIKDFMRSDGGRWQILMDKIILASVAYLNAQVTSGADALQIFDSWAGALTPDEYRTYAMPYTQKLIAGLNKTSPIIHFGTKTGPFIGSIAEAGGHVIGVDHRMSLLDAWSKIGYHCAVQGNLDPELLLGSASDMESNVKRILKEVSGRPGHIFNLGHGVLPDTPEVNAKKLVQMVHELSRRK